MSAKPTAPAISDTPSLELQPATPLEEFLDKNFKTIAYAVLGLIAAGAIYGIVNYRSKQAALVAAQEATAAKTVEDCSLVASKYKGTVAGGNALLNKARLQWQANNKDQAVATLREFKANYSSHPFYQQGVLALASRLEAMGGNNVKEAKALFEEIAKNKDSDLAGLAQIRIADILWNEGKQDDARKIYEELPRKFGGQFFEENQKRLDWIAAGLPTTEVDPPKVPDALKPPAAGATPPAPGSAPAINLTPGKSGVPATSAPFEVKMTPPAPAAGGDKPKAQPKIEIKPNPAPAPAPAIDGKSPLTPGDKPAQSKSGEAQPQLKLDPNAQPKIQINANPVPAAPPTLKLDANKPQTPASPAPAPAPAPAKSDEAPKK